MQMRHIRFQTSRAKWIAHAIGDDSKALVAFYLTAQLHLNICQELVLADPSIAVINDDVTFRYSYYGPRPGCCSPKIGCIFALDHITARSKINRTTNRIMMGTV